MKILSLHPRSALAGFGLAVLAAIAMGQQFVGSPAVEVVRVLEPQKVLGTPAPSEWLDLTSNPVGQPATTYVVPVGNTLTLRGILLTPPFVDTAAEENIGWSLTIDGASYGTGIFNALGAVELGVEFAQGLVLVENQVVTIERIDPGQSASNFYADDAATFSLRGVLETQP